MSDLEFQPQIEALNQIPIPETIPSMRTPRKTPIVTNYRSSGKKPNCGHGFGSTKISLFGEFTVPELVIPIRNINIAKCSCTRRLTILFFFFIISN